MSDEYLYQGKPLSSYSLWDLGLIEKSLKEMEAARDKAGTHPKFNMDRKDGTKVIKKMNFPPPNPEFLKLKSEIEAEIRKRQNASAI